MVAVIGILMGADCLLAGPQDDDYRVQKFLARNLTDGGLAKELRVNGSVTTRLNVCLLYTSPSPRDQRGSRMPSSA